MVRHFIWLKVRLTWNGLRADWQRRIGFPGILVLMAVLAHYLAQKFTAAHGSLNGAQADELALWAALVLWAGWVALPVVIFPLDENLDPARFATLPFGRRQLITGLGLSSLVAPSAVVPLVLLTMNLSRFPLTVLPLGILAMAILLGQMVVASQLFTAAMSAVLRSRRGRDLAVFVVIGLGLFFFGAYQVMAGQVEQLGLAGALATHPISGWSVLPPLASQRVLLEAEAGHIGAAITYLLVALAWLAVLSLAWERLLGYLLTTPDSSPRPSRARRSQGLAVNGPWGTRSVLARKELRFYVRDPRQRLVWTGTVVFVGLAIAAVVVGSEGMATFRHSTWLPLLAPGLVLFVGLPISLNIFGWERNAASYLFALPVSPRSLIQGKNMASGLAMLVETVFLALLLTFISGSWSVIYMVPALAVSAIGAQLAVGNLVSVLTPLRLPREGTDVFAQTTEQGFLAIFSQAAAFLTIGVLLVPPSVGAVLTFYFGGALKSWITFLFSILWGIALYWMSLLAAAWLLRRRVPEVVNRVQVY